MSVDVGKAIGYLDLDISGFKSGFDEANESMDKFKNDSDSTNEKFKALGSSLSSVGGSLTKYVTLPLVGIGTTAVASAASFESAFKDMSSSLGATSQEAGELKEAMKNVFAEGFGENFDDVATAIGDVRKQMQGLSQGELENTTKKAIAFRDTFGYEVPESIRAANALMKNFGTTADEAYDLMTKGAQNGLDFSGELIDNINEYSVQFKKLGFSAEDMFNIFESGAESGAWNLDKIGDAIKEFSIRAIDGSNTTIDGFNKLGMNADKMASKFAKGGDTAREAFFEVAQAISEIDDPVEQSIVGVDLFGTMWEDLGPEVITQLAGIKDASYDAAGAMDQLIQTKYDSLSGQLNVLKNNVKLLGVSFGELLLPVITPLVEKFANFIKWLTELDDTTKRIITSIGLAAAAIGPILLIAGKVLTFISTIKSSMAALSLTFSGIAAPLGIAIAAIAAFALAWSTNFGGIRDTVTNIMGQIKNVISSIINAIKDIWNSNFLLIKDNVMYVFSQIETVIRGALGVIEGIVQVFSGIITGDWSKVWEGVKKIFSSIWETIKNLLKNFLNHIVDSIIKIGANLFVAAKKAFQKIKDGFLEKWNAIKAWFAKAKEDPVTALKELPGKLFKSGKNAFESLWKGFKSVWTKIKNWFKSVGKWIKSKLQFWKDSVAEAEDTGDSAGGGGGGGKKKNKVKGYAKGLEYVPYDGFPAILHKGERVLTKTEADNYNKGGTGATYQFTFNSPQELSPSEQRRQFKKTMNELLFSM